MTVLTVCLYGIKEHLTMRISPSSPPPSPRAAVSSSNVTSAVAPSLNVILTVCQ